MRVLLSKLQLILTWWWEEVRDKFKEIFDIE